MRTLAQNARFDAPTCLVSSRWLSGAVAVSMGEAARPLLVEGFKTLGDVVLLPGCSLGVCAASCVVGVVAVVARVVVDPVGFVVGAGAVVVL